MARNRPTKEKYDYEKYQRDSLIRSGFRPDELSQEQIDIILEPVEAPENFMCDGEISLPQALARWKQNLRNAGLSDKQILMAVIRFGR